MSTDCEAFVERLQPPKISRNTLSHGGRAALREGTFEELDVRLTAEVFSWNDTSGRVLEKVGFQREGRFRSHQKKEGAFVDVLYYGLLHDDILESSEPSDFRA